MDSKRLPATGQTISLAEKVAFSNRFNKLFSDGMALVEESATYLDGENSRRPLVFSPEAMEALRRYPWSGNVRELINLVERLVILVDGDAVYLSDLPDHIFESSQAAGGALPETKLPEQGLNFNEIVERFENSLILQALERTGGNKKAAAELLNLNRTTLVEKIKKKGLDPKLGAREQNGAGQQGH